MSQRQIRHKPNRFTKCTNCQRQPRHIQTTGRAKLQTMHWATPAVRHHLECACGRATAECGTLREAEEAWGMRDSQIPLRLPKAVTHIHSRRGKRKAVRS